MKKMKKIVSGLLLFGFMFMCITVEPVYAGQWQQDTQGFKYQEDDGIWMQWQWKRIGYRWYYFDEWGHRVTGWRNIDQQWYHFDQDGRMESYKWIDGYYVGADGRRITNAWIGNDWFNEEGIRDTTDKIKEDIPLESISLNKDSIVLLSGETANLVPDSQSQKAVGTKTIRWKSLDSSIATVHQGKVTAVSEGTTQILAILGDKTAVCDVVVKESVVCKAALTLLDSQYIWGGDGPFEGGVDCSGLLMYAFTVNGYDFGADLNANNFAKYGQEVTWEELQPGDAICTCFNGERYQHILLYIGNHMVIASECGGPTVCTAGLTCDQHVLGVHCNCRTWKRPLNENDLINAKFVRMDAYKKQ